MYSLNLYFTSNSLANFPKGTIKDRKQPQPCSEAELCAGGSSWFCAAADSDALGRPLAMERDVLPLLHR